MAADRGELWVAGHPIHAVSRRDLAAARRNISFVFQQFNLVRRLSAHRNAVAGRLATTPLWRVVLGHFAAQDRLAAHQALDRVGLADHAHRRVDQLSGGEQQRVAIARALVQGSRVVLADEPIASLDLPRAREVLLLLRSLAREEGLTILSALHQPDLAGRYADRVVAVSDLVEVPRPIARTARAHAIETADLCR